MNTLRQAYNASCNAYLQELLSRWDTSGYWVADDIGDTFCFDDDGFITMRDIIYCVDNNVTREEYQAYTDYCLRCAEYGFHTLNLPAFHKGAPRIPTSAFDRLDTLKQDLHNAIEEEKAKQNNNKH